MNTTWQWQNYLRKLAISLFILFANLYADVPMPGHSIAQSSGLTAGLGIGTQRQMHSGCKALVTWTAQASYAYKPFLSSGASINFLGGNIDRANNLINQKYSINLKVMHNKPKYALYSGPILSIENTDLSELRDEFINRRDEQIEYTECRNLFEAVGSGIGWRGGVGFLPFKSWGMNFGYGFDWTLKNYLMVHFSSGIAFNLREHFEKLKNNSKNFWLSLEYVLSPSKSYTNTHSITLGLTLGF